MLVKIITFFLIFMAVLAMLGRWRRRPKGAAPRKCPGCGAPLVGRGGCACGAG